MKAILYFLLLLTSSAYCQEVEIGTVFTIEFNNPDKNMEFKIVSTKAYLGIFNISKLDSIVANAQSRNNQIIGVFAKGKFGNAISPMLVLKSNLNKNLDYKLEIKPFQKRRFQNTSTSSLFKGVKSIEYWPYSLEKIRFSKFNVISTEKLHTLSIEEKIDSTCIKNADKNIELGEQEFKSYFKAIITKFESGDKFKIEQLLKYEKLANSKDVSLGYYWTLGESIYPNKKGFKFSNPFSFQKIECPYFEDCTEYFYTKAEREVKVVAFNWSTFKASKWRINPDEDLTPKFKEKYHFLTEAVSELLGKPLAIGQEENSGRIDTKWQAKNGINAYLLRFKSYNEIRLYIFKD
jgi:hypothetical protein